MKQLRAPRPTIPPKLVAKNLVPVHVAGVRRLPFGTWRKHLKQGAFDVGAIMNIMYVSRDVIEFLVI